MVGRLRGTHVAFRLVVLLGAVFAACTGNGSTRGPAAATSDVAATSRATGTLSITVTEARYGTLVAMTRPGATCSAAINVTPGEYGEGSSSPAAQVASPDGVVRWTYPAPRVPNGSGGYEVTCASGSANGSATGTFDVSRAPIAATTLSVHVTTATPPQPSFTPDPTLVDLRDKAAARMTATLSSEWKTATRGLGALQVVPDSADITIFVVAAKGISVNRQSRRDRSEDIVIYVNDQNLGVQAVENVVATSLHELGHIWCCFGPDADSGGHWKEKLRDPGLYGVDKYGLMTDPVTCESFGTILSCPNRFSDREMTALGFTSFPPPAPDPCITQSLRLKAQLAAVRDQESGLKATIDGLDATLSSLAAQVQALERQYGYSMPPSVYATYQSLVARYNDLLAQRNADVSQYNGLVGQESQLVGQLNSLPCDSS